MLLHAPYCQANAANNTPRQQLPDAASINRLGYLTVSSFERNFFLSIVDRYLRLTREFS